MAQRNACNVIATNFIARTNPDGWNGKGIQPKTFRFCVIKYTYPEAIIRIGYIKVADSIMHKIVLTVDGKSEEIMDYGTSALKISQSLYKLMHKYSFV